MAISRRTRTLGKVIVMKGEKGWKAEKEHKKQQVIKKAKNLEVESQGTGIELEGKGNEDEADGERLGDEHTSMSSDEDMQAEIEEHVKKCKTENKLEGEGSENEQYCSDCGEKRPERGIVECKACGSVN